MKSNVNKSSNGHFPELIRVSLGTAIVLGLLDGKLDAEPTTAYLMTYKDGKCMANCGFCAQARESKSRTELLSRISWPTFPILEVMSKLGKAASKGKIRRTCIQALNYPSVFEDLQTIVKAIRNQTSLQISVSCQPLSKGNMYLLAKSGVDRLGIALDAATETIFDKIKGKDVGSSYQWKNQFKLLSEAITIFGKGNVSTHLIVGLGETEKEAISMIQTCVDMTTLPALFAFTPIRGTTLEKKTPPELKSYRRVQLARFLIVRGSARFETMQFDCEGKISGFGISNKQLKLIIASAEPFLTSGCQDCNRPFYNEKASGPIFNYPKKPSLKEIEEIKVQLNCF